MKTLVFLAASVACTAIAQTNSETLATNVVVSAPNFRRVNGQLYNVDRSRLWKDITGEVNDKRDGVVLVTTFIAHGSLSNPTYGRTAGLMGGYAGAAIYRGAENDNWKEYGRQIAITNAPDYATLAAGNEFKFTGLRTGTYENHVNSHGPPVELWDCGRPNVVMVVTTNRPPAR